MSERFVGIGGWQKTSLIDFPGTVSAVLFYCGCNLRCPYCHNTSLVDGTGAERVAPELIERFLDKRRGLLEGVVLSGGEATLQPGVVDDAAALRALGYRVKLDTNGLLPEVAARVRPDYLALDVKTVPALYAERLRCTCADAPARLAASVALAVAMGERAEVRITVAPGLLDESGVAQLAGLLRGVRRVYLQPMDQRYPLLDPAYNIATPVSPEQIRVYQQVLARTVGECLIRGA